MLTRLLRPFQHLSPLRVQPATHNIRLLSNSKIACYDMIKYRSDPEYRKWAMSNNAEYRRRRKLLDPTTYAARLKAANVQAHQKRISDSRTWRWKQFNDWLRSGWHAAPLRWKTHRCEVSAQGVRHRCSGCQLPDHETKFWWANLTEPDAFLCGKCALHKLSWEEVCPEGFENTGSRREFTARAKELGIEQSLIPTPKKPKVKEVFWRVITNCVTDASLFIRVPANRLCVSRLVQQWRELEKDHHHPRFD